MLAVAVAALAGSRLLLGPGPFEDSAGADPAAERPLVLTASQESAPLDPSLRQPIAPRTSSEPELRVALDGIGRRGTIDSTLLRLEVPNGPRLAVERALADELDPRRLSAGTGISVVRDETGRILRVNVRSDPDRFLRVWLDNDTDPPRLEWVNLPAVKTIETVGGTIRSSVSEAISDHPDGVRLTNAFAEIVQWDVDLLVDPRPGDVIRMVYEARFLGRLPADLPAYDGEVGQSGQALGPGRVLAAAYEGDRASASAFWVDYGGGAGNYYDRDGRAVRKSFLKSPLNYTRISSGFSFSRVHPVTNHRAPHLGVDYAARTGTPVVATADGRVVSAGWNGALGRTVRIRHGSEYTTFYGHLRGFAKGIEAGADVLQNQVIGYVGSTGRATGPHLHYTIHHHGQPIDPLRFESPAAEPLEPTLAPTLQALIEQWDPILAAPQDETAASALAAAGGVSGSGSTTGRSGG